MRLIGAGMGGGGGKCPHTKNSVGALPHTLPSSSYKYIKYFYIVNSYQQLSPISVETAFACLCCHNTYLFSNKVS